MILSSIEHFVHCFNISSDICTHCFLFSSFNKIDISEILTSQVTAFTDSGTLAKDCNGLFYYDDPYGYDGLYDEPAIVVRRLRSRSCTLLHYMFALYFHFLLFLLLERIYYDILMH